jgi:thioredoxin reductase
MQSKKYKIQPAAKKKNIAVIGGGIGGMEAAIVCAKRGHSVTIYEKDSKLGGIFIAAAAPSFKEKDRDLIAWYERELQKYPAITVEFNTEIKSVNQVKADEIIVATGAKAKNIPIKGVEHSVEACEYLLQTKKVGDKVVIIGGGLTGCEIAYDLYLKGKTPVIVEMLDDLVVTPGVCLANTSYLRDFFETNKVEVHLETALTEILKDGVMVKDKDGKIVGFALMVPSIAKALKKSNGKLFPFGIFRLLKALNGKNDTLEMFLIAVNPEHQAKGLPAIIMDFMLQTCIDNGVKYCETGPELETNEKIQSMWKSFDARHHKRRRCWKKDIK